MIGIDVFKLPFVGENAHVPRDSKILGIIDLRSRNWDPELKRPASSHTIRRHGQP